MLQAPVFLKQNKNGVEVLGGAGGIKITQASRVEKIKVNDHVDIDPWEYASKLFKRTVFPWEIFPKDLASSLEELARSYSCAQEPLAGTLFALIASAIGNKLKVSVKDSWSEPVIVWHADVRDSGSGKTPALFALAKPFWERQEGEVELYQESISKWKTLKPREKGAPPKEPKLIIMTDLTLEGIREPMSDHPTGGAVVLLNELSSMITAQGQYKGGKGNDREIWLALHDGKPANVIRKGGSVYIPSCCICVTGGIQPRVLSEVFGGGKGLFLEDGTVPRFLYTFSKNKYYPLTEETWSQNKKDCWANIVDKAFEYSTVTGKQKLDFSLDALQYFICWRNNLERLKMNLPPALRPFVPKAYGYAVRLTGLIHCLNAFSRQEQPSNTINRETILSGIKTVEFYLAQAIEALKVILLRKDALAYEENEENHYLRRALEKLRDLPEKGLIPIGIIAEAYNENATTICSMSPRKLGSYLRNLGFKTKRANACGKRENECLVWGGKVESFLN
jgi:Protein of unknown function (DUF3987)